jgi:2-isopropylmalate synthase
MKKRVYLYDATLRDGAQGEGVNFSSNDKLLIARKLDAFGIDYIEGGWPGSNPKDIDFFEKVRDIQLKHAKVAAFGSTRHARHTAADDRNLQLLIEAQTPVVTIFGKSWLLHVKEALRVKPDNNLAMIRDSVVFLKQHGRETIFDAEHFFDGYADDAAYAMTVLETAVDAGADCLSLCDTNGGCVPQTVEKIVKAVCTAFPGVQVGFHGHNDAACGVANSLAAVAAGTVHVQGTINGLGERCGNADLTGIIPGLVHKMDCETGTALEQLTDVSRFVDEIANLPHNKRQPYTGISAFAHKAGIHVSAMQRNERTYEHIPPNSVGNTRRVLVSELSGKSNILFKARELGIDIDDKSPEVKNVLEVIKQKEHLGYEYEAADASFELLIQEARGLFIPSFEILGFRVIDEERRGGIVSEATIKVRVEGEEEHTAAEGDGPVHALDTALRKALRPFYPFLEQIKLIDYKVRVLTVKEYSGTASKVLVLVESTDGHDVWGTVGVSTNIIEASYEALIDSVEYKLMKTKAANGMNTK